jgi:hypothetical protein
MTGMARQLARVGLVLTLAACAASSGTAAAAGRTLDNFNWSGYAAEACHTCQVRYVTATWKVPAVDCASSPPGAWAVAWAGLDGLTSGTVEQAGTYSICTSGQASYDAWYQMYPAASVIWGQVDPGDLVTADVYHDAGAARWNLALTDHTTGEAWSTAQPCPHVWVCAGADAEVIVEAPAAGPTLPLADFGTAQFTGIGVTSRDGTRGAMATGPLWTVHPVDLVTPAGRVLATPGPVSDGGRAFTDTWRAAQ